MLAVPSVKDHPDEKEWQKFLNLCQTLVCDSPTMLSLNLKLSESMYQIIIHIIYMILQFERDAHNYIDPIRTSSQNLKGLHRTNQEQPACSKSGNRRGPDRVLREA